MLLEYKMNIKVCKLCKNNYDKDSSLFVHRYGYCTTECFRTYRKSNDYKYMCMKTYIKKRGVNNIDTLSDEKIKSIFHKLKSDDVKLSQPKRVNTIKKIYGENAFKDITKRGNSNKKLKFLKDNNLYKENMNVETINKLYKQNFNKISLHGNKIKDGRLKKYGTKENVKLACSESIKKSLICQVEKHFSINYNDFTQENFDVYCKKYRQHIHKKTPELVLNWKQNHLIKFYNNGFSEEQILLMDSIAVDRMYSEYLSDRMNKLGESLYNGWKNTKNGFYKFNNGITIFYRSSWELEFFKKIDNIDSIVNIKLPPSYRYMDKNDIYRRYFPDIQFEYNGIIYIIEIKPFSKVLDNFHKFSEILCDTKIEFRIITEYDIFFDKDNDDKMFWNNLKYVLKNKVNENEYKSN